MTNMWLADALAEPTQETVLYLRRSDVRRCLDDVDVVAAIQTALVRHHEGLTTLPSEAYLSWQNSRNAYTRSIGMPGSVDGAHGMKIINASVSNPDLGMERAAGLGLCFDEETARITAVMEVGMLSAIRTACVTAVAIEATGYGAATSIGVVGCGAQARVHLALLLSRCADVRSVALHDTRPGSAETLATGLAARHPDVSFSAAATAADAMANADIMLFLTTATEGYVVPEWIADRALLVNVSLGDLTDDVLLGAEDLYVDDVQLIAENPRRPLGRLIGEGRIARKPEEDEPAISATIGELLATRTEPTRPDRGYVVVNPFGLGVLDVTLFDTVRRRAVETGVGQRLPLY